MRRSMIAVLLIPIFAACAGDDGTGLNDDDGDDNDLPAGMVAAEGVRFMVDEAGNEISFDGTTYRSSGGTMSSSGSMSSQLTSQWIYLDGIREDEAVDSIVVTYTASIGGLALEEIEGTVDTTESIPSWDEATPTTSHDLAEGESVEVVIRHPDL